MKIFIALAGFLVLGAAHAEVYKCKTPDGGVEYQSAPCAAGPSEQVNITPADPEKIKAAQAKLAESLKQQAEREAAEAKIEQREREVAAQEAIASGISNQSNAIQRNTEALENANQPQPVYPYYVAPLVAPAPSPMPRPPLQRDINPMPPRQR